MPALPRPGDRLSGYRIERELGRGATGVVYLARQEALDRRVALKVVGPPLSDDAAFRERFRHEARAAAALDHPNVVTVLDSGDDAEHLWLAMRLVDGPDLRVLLRRTGRLEPEQAVAVVEQVAAALDVAHAAGLVHRDVKPGNVLVEDGPGRELHVSLADFGLVRPAGPVADDPEGTPGYAAPEQLAGDDATAAADVYGLGCILFELLAGVPPPVADSSRDADTYVRREGLRPSRSRPDIAPAFDAVVLRATDPDPAVRTATAGAVAVAARAALMAPRPRIEAPATPAQVREAAGVLVTPAELAADAEGAEADGETGAPATTLVAEHRRRRWWPWALPLVVLLGVLAAAFLFIGDLGSGQRLGILSSGGASGLGGSVRGGGASGSVRGGVAGGPRGGAGAAAGPVVGRRGTVAAAPSGDDESSRRGSAVGGGDVEVGADSGGSGAVGASPGARQSVPRVPGAGPGGRSASAISPVGPGLTRFGGGGWLLDLPTAERWRQTAVQELDGGRLLLTRLERPDGTRLVVELRPGQTAVFGPWPGRSFVLRLPVTGRQTGLLFSGGRYEMCRLGVCAAVPVNGPSGGVLLLAGARSAVGARRVLTRSAHGLRVH